MTLTEFLLARITEDEAVASQQRIHDLSTCNVLWHHDFNRLDHEWMYCECGVPSRIEAECEAKRGLVQLGDQLASHDDMGSSTRDDGIELLQLLALPYADHPDYDTTWRP